MRRRSRRSLKRQLGAEIVEFIVTLPVILIAFALVVELGIGFVDQAVLTNASRVAAREAIRIADSAQADAAAQAAADRVFPSLISLRADSPAPTVTVNRSGSNPGDDVTVTVAYTYQFLLIPAFASTVANLTLTAQTVMRMLPV